MIATPLAADARAPASSCPGSAWGPWRRALAGRPEQRQEHRARAAERPSRRMDELGLEGADDQGYLLQIFTKNLVGPLFFEFIQRENHLSFGEGNFGALFRSIERDQERRGVLG